VNSSSYIEIKATVPAKRIRIKEDPSVSNWPTTDYLIKGDSPSSAEIRVPAGSGFAILDSHVVCNVGQTVGYIKSVTGTTTFQMIEE
jgi:hypothetical protein